MDYEAVVKALEEYFKDYGLSKGVEYYFGYFDALAVVRKLQEEHRHDLC